MIASGSVARREAFQMPTISPPQLDRLEAALASHHDAVHFLEIAEMYRRSGHHRRAVRVLQRGLENHPTSGAGFALLAAVLAEEGRHAEALACWERLLELDSGNEDALRGAAEARARIAAGEEAPPPVATAPWRSASLPETYAAWQPPQPESRAPASSPTVREAAPPTVVLVSPPEPPTSAEPAEGDETAAESPAPVASVASLSDEEASSPAAGSSPAEASSPVAGSSAAEASSHDVAGSSAAEASSHDVAIEDRPRAASGSTTVAIADVLVGLLEYRDPFFRGGTNLTRLLSAAVARRMGLDDATVEAIEMGAVLRDLGQLPLKALIAKPGALDAAAKRQLERHVETTLELLAPVDLPEDVRLTIRHHHERWDGAGYPDGLAGDAIPLGARIVAVADSFAAMIAARAHRLPKRVPVALEELRAGAGSRYDPDTVEALARVVSDPDWRAPGFGLRQHVILVDPDETRAMVRASRIGAHGYLAETAVATASALERARRSRMSALIVSADLPAADVERLLADVRGSSDISRVPVIVTDASATQRIALLEAGADACLASGSGFDELKATFEAFLRRERRNEPMPGADASWAGLQGDLQDFPLSWLLQVLNYDARTAAVFITAEFDEGVIFLDKGSARHARTRSLEGEAALRSLLKWRSGSFRVDPDERTDERTILTPLMNLILEQAVIEDHAAYFGSVPAD
jgi:HD-GYP domain-containing protein (c-di-GMP phosphodiesterase class II)/DNA-binding response OmpR family regulator